MTSKRLAITTGLLAATVLAIAAWVGWPHLRFWYLFESLGANAQGYPEYRHRQSGIVLVRLPGGRFSMGAQKENPDGPNYDPEAADDEAPVHEVTLSPFLIAKTEVTQAQWKRVMGWNPSYYTGEVGPVEFVSRHDIQEFEARTGLVLPSEAQWEYACRAGTTASFAGKLDDLAWFVNNIGGETHPVGMKGPNGFGLQDLHGNVTEWCEDVYDPEFYGKLEAAGPDPVSTAGSMFKVYRGGSWFDVAVDCRSSVRGGSLPSCQLNNRGFRPAYRLP